MPRDIEIRLLELMIDKLFVKMTKLVRHEIPFKQFEKHQYTFTTHASSERPSNIICEIKSMI